MENKKVILSAIPHAWDELSKESFRFVVALLQQNLPEDKFLTYAFLYFCKLKLRKTLPEPAINPSNNEAELLYLFRYKKKHFCLSATDVAGFLDKFRFLLDGSGPSRDLVGDIRIRFKKFAGPSDRLYNITLAEYIHAENFFNRFTESLNDSDLNKFIAVLWRPVIKVDKKSVAYTGDTREKFNDFLTDNYAKKIARLDPVTKNMILLFYIGCRTYLMKRFSILFDSGTTEPEKEKVNPVEALLELVERLADGDVTKKENIRNSMLYDVLPTLEYYIKQDPKPETDE